MPTSFATVSRLRRRSFLTASGAAFAALVVQLGRRPKVARAAVYGALVPDPDGILDLPAGFSYRIVDQFGEAMDDGYVVPSLPDGMATFAGPEGTVILMRNHELLVGDGPYEPGSAPPEAFDPVGMGCVTRVVFDATTYERLSSNLVLCGTLTNCAGGWSPWGWLSCEENATVGHGYVFVCDPLAEGVQAPRPQPALGRFKHEAAAVDTATGAIYLTEDLKDSCLYRFLPDDPSEPFVGRLQALKVVGVDVALTTEMAVGDPPVAIEWVDVDDPDPVADDVRIQAQAKGAAIFVRGEGIVFTTEGVYVVATTGGPIGKGQIFRLVDDGGAQGTLEVVAASVDTEFLDMPDNITMAPWGELFFCEDGSNGNYLRGLTAAGELFDFALNVKSENELAGVCFSPAGDALFVNLQKDNMTLVITGPFPKAPEPGETDSDSGDSDSGGTDGGGTDSDGASSSGTDSDAASAGDSDSDSAATTAGEDGPPDSGCGCSADTDGGDVLASAAVAGLIGLAVSERRRADD
ncbi:MAG: DUF839 domain-containing protein [Nannocystaceae bacterium]